MLFSEKSKPETESDKKKDFDSATRSASFPIRIHDISEITFKYFVIQNPEPQRKTIVLFYASLSLN